MIAVSEPSSKFLIEWLLSQFPVSPALFDDSCLSVACLHKMASTLRSLDYPADFDTNKLRSGCKTVVIAPALLKALETMLSSENAFSSTQPDNSGRRNARSRRETKPLSAHILDIDEKPFVEMDVPVPQSQLEATELINTVITGQRDFLSVGIFVQIP
jgi:hypothetical protein